MKSSMPTLKIFYDFCFDVIMILIKEVKKELQKVVIFRSVFGTFFSPL
jgi:hypothetical protein